MPFSDDPILDVLIAAVLWGLWAACVRRDLVARRRKEREAKR